MLFHFISRSRAFWRWFVLAALLVAALWHGQRLLIAEWIFARAWSTPDAQAQEAYVHLQAAEDLYPFDLRFRMGAMSYTHALIQKGVSPWLIPKSLRGGGSFPTGR